MRTGRTPRAWKRSCRIVDKVRSLPVLLIVTFRPEFEPPWIGRPYVTALTLNRLAQRNIEAMIDGVVGNKFIPAMRRTSRRYRGQAERRQNVASMRARSVSRLVLASDRICAILTLRFQLSGQPLLQSLKGFQELTLAAFAGLRDGIDGQVRGFGERLELGGNFQRLGARVSESLGESSRIQKERLENVTLAVSGLSEKLEKGQESLRSAVESRLDTIRQENAAKLDEMRQTVDEKLQTTLETPAWRII
jgi:ribosomal protein L28